jgi:hypothetical protein
MIYKLICCGVENEIIFDNLRDGVQFINNSDLKNEILNRKCYKIGNDRIEIIKLNSEINNIASFEFINYNEGRVLLVLSEINDDNILKLNELFKNKNVIILAIRKKISLDIYKLNLEIISKLIILKQSYFNNKIDVEFILLPLLNNYDKNKLIGNAKERYLILGWEDGENALGKIVLNVLKSCNDIHRYENLALNLYPNKEFDLQELTYIEDPLREYMEEDAKLIIKQITNNNMDGKVYFSMLINYKN